MERAQGARLRRTKMFFEDRPAFLKQLTADIAQFAINAAALNYEAVYRLNGTSDIRWELYGVPQAFPARRFYDYTRLFNRKGLPPNYHLTYSWSGTNKDACLQALQGGINVAVPFIERPTKFMGYAVVDGDEDDTRFLDAKGVVIGLRPKGKLRGQAGLVWLGDSHPELCA